MSALSHEEIAAIKAYFGADCTEVLVEGDDPLMLDDPMYAYITQSSHQLFCVGWQAGPAVSRNPFLSGASTGRREHVALCGPGQLLLGVKPTAGTVLMVSGQVGSQVLRIPIDRARAALADSSQRALAERLFESWVLLLISTLPAAPVPTRCGLVVADSQLPAYAGSLAAANGMLWITLPKAPSRYGGANIEENENAPTVWPVTATTWLTCDVEEGATVSATSRQLREGHVDEFYAFVIGRLAKMRAEVQAGRLERDVASRAAEREFVGDALRRLAYVGLDDEGISADDLGHGDAFEQACARIAKWLEVPIFAVPTPASGALLDIQTAIAQITAVRTRKVVLDDGWWVDDAGPLLGFFFGEDEKDLHPVALLPSPRGYRVFDARKSEPEKLTPELAERLHPQAHQFYEPLPDRALSPLDVLRFSTKRGRRDIVFVMVLGLTTGALSMSIPLLTEQVFDNIIPGAERNLLVQLTCVLVFVYIGQALFDFARSLALVRLQTRMDSSLEAGVWDRLLGLPLPFFREYSAGELSSRAAGISGIRDILAGTTVAALLGGLFSAWNFLFLFTVNGKLAVASTGLVLLAMIPAIAGTYYGLKRQRTVAAIDGKIEGLLLQLLSGIAKLRVTAAENRAFAVWGGLFSRRRDADMGAERVNVRIAIFQSVYPLVCSMVLFWMLTAGGRQAITTGQYLAFSSAFGIFLSSTLQVIGAGLSSLAVIPLYERAKPILQTRVEGGQSLGQRVDLKGGIEVNHLSFRYSAKGPLILDDVSFQIAAGEFVALVGPSGSGKSTLLRLLLGFDAATEGGVFYDGQSLAGLDVRVVRKQIGVVMQSSRVMGGDIYTNIVGSTGLTHEDAWRAARNAALDNDIEAMPMAMHTVVAQGGGTLSGGQRQRLLIARALAPQPKILFFDEATSALDNVTQAAVSQSLESLHVTRVVIAHRLSTIRHADKIIVVEKGRIVQQGRFDELVAQEGPFKTLAKRQMV